MSIGPISDKKQGNKTALPCASDVVLGSWKRLSSQGSYGTGLFKVDRL